MIDLFSIWKLKRKPRYSYISTVDLPENINENVIYIVGENHCKWLAMLICPCGCGDVIQLNLLPECDDQWTIKIKRKLITITPSINRRLSCKAHFLIIKGHLEWF